MVQVTQPTFMKNDVATGGAIAGNNPIDGTPEC
jgi:hypothetical protein